MKKLFNDAKILAELSALLIVSSIGLVVYAGGGNPGQVNPTIFQKCSSISDPDTCDANPNCLWEFPNCIERNAQESIPEGEWNTASLTTNEDGSKTIIWSGMNLTLASGDLADTYQWGTTNPGANFVEDRNAWGGGSDSPDNGYDSGNPKSQRQGPCDAGWHVPSAGEWNKIIIAWCHLSTNECEESNINIPEDPLNYLNDDDLSLFRTDFSLVNGEYWSSTPGYYTVNQSHYMRINNDTFIGAIYTNPRDNSYKVRCMKNPERTVSFNANGGTTSTGSIQITEGEALNLSQYIASKNGYTFVGWNESSTATDPLPNNYIVNGNVTLYAIFEEEWNTATIDTNADLSKTITYNGKSYTLAQGDLDHPYRWGTTSPSQAAVVDNRNAWGGSGDNEENGFDSGNSRIYREGPCNAGRHVPSRGEWNAIVTAWCHLDSNNCTSSNLKHASDRTSSNNLIYIDDSALASGFRTDFGMSDNWYWSSSPDGDDSAFNLNVAIYIDPAATYMRDDSEFVRCIKNPTKTVSFNANGGTTSTESIQITEGEALNLSQYIASKNGYTFVGWNTSSTATDSLPNNYIVNGNVTLYAIFNKNSSGGSNYSGGGGRKSSSTNTEKQTNAANTGNATQNNADKSNVNKTDSSKEGSSDNTNKGQKVPELDMERYNPKYSLERNLAYQFAYTYGITNKLNISNANMYGKLTRIQMAKMLSTYAINVLGKEPDYSRGIIKFSDVSNSLDRKYSNGVTLAYQLGVMGQNIRSGKFRPYDEVTRAEFATALSRLLYGIKDGTGKVKYYEPHLAKLYNEGIISKRDPSMKEKRGYVMLMLTRSVK